MFKCVPCRVLNCATFFYCRLQRNVQQTKVLDQQVQKKEEGARQEAAVKRSDMEEMTRYLASQKAQRKRAKEELRKKQATEFEELKLGYLHEQRERSVLLECYECAFTARTGCMAHPSADIHQHY